MYLKRLELQGFKSFPEKIRLEFNKGITAVVGPNGSGKSNISDAVRWVLGEQSAKSLRGTKMEDVIFAGTQNRRALGFAEVSMVLDNTDRRMNVDFSEIMVTRRTYRSGESQFSINGTACRLKDIHELFMDTGIGREGYSIIGQGRVEEILSTRSEDRRLLFEEAVGIVKYKNRKTDAERKLERERQNLIRVNDIITELEAQLEPLAKQAEKAKQYMSLAERYKLVAVNLFVHEAAKAESVMDGMTQNLEDLRAQITDTERVQNEAREATEAHKHEAAELTAQAEAASEAAANLRLDAEKKENDIRLCDQAITHIENDKTRIRGEIEVRHASIQESETQAQGFEARLDAAELERAAKEEQRRKTDGELGVLEAQLAKSEGMIEKYTSEHIDRLRAITDVKGKIERAEAMYEQLEARKEELDEERQLNESRIHDTEIQQQALTKDLAEKDAQTEGMEAKLAMLWNDRGLAEADIADTGGAQKQAARQLHEAQSRHKLLTELEAGHEGYYRSVKAILREKKNNPAAYKGVRGAVAELLTVPEKFETAIEIALGGALQNLITETEADAQRAIAFLKQTNNGRATFLPMSAVQGKRLSNADALLQEPGLLDTAVQAVAFDVVYDGVMASLLGRVLIADTLDNAVRFSKKYKYAYKVVTLDGDLINPGGALSGGSHHKSSTGILSRGREIAALKASIAALSEETAELEARLQNAQQRFDSIVQQIERGKMLVQETALARASVQANLTQTGAALHTLIENREAYAIEERQLMAQIVAANGEIRRLTDEQKQIESEISDILQTMDTRQEAVTETKAAKDRKLKELTGIQVTLSALEQNVSSARENAARIQNDIQAAHTAITRLAEELAGLDGTKARREAEIESLREDILALEARHAAANEGIADLAAKRSALSIQMDEMEAAAAERVSALTKLNGELARLEVKREQIETDNRRLYDEMWDEYEITYQTALQYPHLEDSPTQLTRESKELKNGMRDLGPVNVGAIEEYKTVGERYAFLDKQRGDILEAEEKLNEIIQELVGLMEAQFREQFTVISANFGVVFAEMFGGGKAYLRLADESNILESGIDIIAQPPGKTLQQMSLLSGGERSLTAIALLFAILRMKPSPFCVLDEIEAALDDANVKRFANYLRNFSFDTQFIVITHRKGTMESADVMYGVTMQEQGVSKLVSVKFTEAV